MWHQKSRIQWMKEGEKNTKFFNRKMIQHRHINKIVKLEDAQGRPLTKHEDIEQEMIINY